MFMVKNKNLAPYQILLFGALGLYLYKLNKANKDSLGGTKINIDTEKLSRAAMPFVPVGSHVAPAVQAGLKKTLDVVFERIKK